jgi:hypothetical protein
MRMLLLASPFLLLASAASAALPPYYQRVEEMERILADARVEEALKSQPVDRLERLEDDLYRATGGACSVDIRIIDKPDNKPEGWTGPRQFDLNVAAPRCN